MSEEINKTESVQPAQSDEDKTDKAIYDLSTVEVTRKLREAPVYRKNVIVEARVVEQPEQVVTTLADGKEETTNTAEVGDYIVTNPSGEKYVLKPDNFLKRNESIGNGKYRAKGKSRIYQNDTGGPISIMAPWGELQHGDTDCMIATVYDPEKPEEVGDDRYIIGRKEFEQTYELNPKNEE